MDTNGRLYFGADGGLRFTDITAAPVPVAADANFPGIDYPAPDPVYFPLNVASQVNFVGDESVNPGTVVYLGGYPASTSSSSGLTSVEIPASSVAGPVGQECIGTSDFTFAVSNAISYGVQVATSGATLLPATGTPTIDLFGYGILDSLPFQPRRHH